MDIEDDLPIKALTEIETEGCCPTLYVLTVYDKGTLALKVSDGKQLWDGTFHRVALASMAEKAKLAADTFMKQSLHALTQCGNEAVTYAFSTRIDSSNNLVFAWKKYVVSENVKFQIASVTLQESSETISSMLEFAVSSISSLKEDISSLTKTVENLKKERSQALEKLEQCATLKEDLESDLYGKFKLVLNDKKAKIRLFNEKMKALTEENQQLKDKSVTAVTSANNKKDHTTYDSEATTDDEAASTDNRKEIRTPSPVSKVAVEEESVDVSMSSLLGGTTEKISSPPVKRRRVREVKKPPKQPVITRPVETTSKKPKLPSRPTRSSSNASSHSSLEADDLLEKM